MNNLLFLKGMFEMKRIIFIGLLIISIATANAQVIVTSAGNVDMCVGGPYKTIPDFKVAEKVNADFKASSSLQIYKLSAPNNFEFNPGVGSVKIPSSTDISFAYLNVTKDTITLNYFLNATAQKDSFILKNIQVRAVGNNSSSDLRLTAGNAYQNQTNNNLNEYAHAHFNSNQAYVDLNASKKVVCANASDITLNGSPGSGTYSVMPSSSALTGSTFKPSVSGAGSFVISYTANQNGCSGIDTVHITVKAIPTVTFFGLGNTYCSNEDSVVLIGFPNGGTFSGNGMFGSIFKPKTLSAGNTSITYSYTNSSGCSNTSTKSGIIIAQAPSVTVSLYPDQSTYQTTSKPVLISGTQTNPSSGGTITLSGNGVSDITKKFYPGSTGEGTFDITRTLVAPNGCKTKDSKTVTVASSNGVSINGLLPKYCIGDGISDLSSTYGTGTFSGPGISVVNSANGTAKFSPNSVNFKGSDTTIHIIYTYNYLGGALFEIRDTTRIFKKPLVELQQESGINSTIFKTVFCGNDSSVTLRTIVFPLGGVMSYSGSGVEFVSSKYIFNPEIASDNNTVVVKYTDPNGCINTDTKSTKVYGKPIPNFNVSSYCEGDIIHLKDSASTVVGNGVDNEINTWGWQVGNLSYDEKNIDVVLPLGNHSITYKIFTKAGCSASIQKNIFIGPYPKMSFSWLKVCNGDVTEFSNDTEIPNGTGWINTIRWNFMGIKDTILMAVNANPTKSYWNISYKFLDPGVYTITQTAITDKNCKSIHSEKVFIFPTVAIGKNTPYVSDFQTDDGGWISSTAADTASSWACGLTNKSIIKPVINNDRFWVTNLNGFHKLKEHSYVYSPCFVLDDITKPMVHMDIWSATNLNVAGTNFQYSLNGIDWFALGDAKSGGINWYNNKTPITSRPSGELSLSQDGWTGIDEKNGWKNVRHVFDDVIGLNKQIRFRVSFAGTENVTDGFAFDNIWIGDRKRLILAEHFTNNSSLNTLNENNHINDLITANLIDDSPKDIVQLQYHTSFPGFDPMNDRNIPDAGARSLYYGITQIPFTAIDGSYYSGNTLGISQNTIDTRSLYDPAFDIALNPIVTATTVTGDVQIINKIPIKNSVNVYVSLLERYVNYIPGRSGEETYQWVHAKFLPNAAGISFEADWSGQLSKKINLNWNIPAGYFYDDKKVAMIAFVQDNVTKEIYQAAYKPIGATVITNTFEPNEATSTVSLYPNPANDVTTVVLNGKLKGSYSWLIFDELGRVVDEGLLQDGTEGFTINTQNYASGFYTLRLSNSSDGVKTQKFVVVH